MTCSSCGTENEAGSQVLQGVRRPAVAACPSCGTPNSPDAKFCGECALALRGRARPPASPRTGLSTSRPGSRPPVAERRLVTVLFADLVGFTPFAEERDAEEVRETLIRYFDLASDIVARYGGTVEKFIGDAVMAVWGAPTAHEDDAERAVRAGARAGRRRARRSARASRPAPGVLTGEAAVTLGATNQGMVAGDLVNTAARLQSVAPAGRGARGRGDRSRGQPRPSPSRRPASRCSRARPRPSRPGGPCASSPQRGGQGRSDLPEPPFVGRDEELRLLKDALTRDGPRPPGAARLDHRPGGIGKSRLAWELEKYIDGVVEDIYWHRGRSPAYGEGITFWALGEMVRRRAGLAETDDEATTASAHRRDGRRVRPGRRRPRAGSSRRC